MNVTTTENGVSVSAKKTISPGSLLTKNKNDEQEAVEYGYRNVGRKAGILA
jgi:hypothetical protein